jgi:hypothetical protein
VGYTTKGNMYTEINLDGSYAILTSGTCVEWKLYIRSLLKQLNELILDNNRKLSWNPRAKFVVPLMSNCMQFENKIISRSILELLWKVKVMNYVVLFLNSNKHAGNDL